MSGRKWENKEELILLGAILAMDRAKCKSFHLIQGMKLTNS